jgi:hypothetical protein
MDCSSLELVHAVDKNLASLLQAQTADTGDKGIR